MPNPGSFREFESQLPDQQRNNAFELHSAALRGYRAELAEHAGVPLDDLHTIPFSLGMYALDQTVILSQESHQDQV